MHVISQRFRIPGFDSLLIMLSALLITGVFIGCSHAKTNATPALIKLEDLQRHQLPTNDYITADPAFAFPDLNYSVKAISQTDYLDQEVVFPVWSRQEIDSIATVDPVFRLFRTMHFKLFDAEKYFTRHPQYMTRVFAIISWDPQVWQFQKQGLDSEDIALDGLLISNRKLERFLCSATNQEDDGKQIVMIDLGSTKFNKVIAGDLLSVFCFVLLLPITCYYGKRLVAYTWLSKQISATERDVSTVAQISTLPSIGRYLL